MDLVIFIGIVGVFGIVIMVIFFGGSFSQFIDVFLMLIVIGGGLVVMLIRFQVLDIVVVFIIGFKVVFGGSGVSLCDLIFEMINFGEIVCKFGFLGLENVDVFDLVLVKGV